MEENVMYSETNNKEKILKYFYLVGFISAIVGAAIYAVIIAVGLIVWGKIFLFSGYAFTKVFAVIGLILMIVGFISIITEFIIKNISKTYAYSNKKKFITSIVLAILCLTFSIIGIADMGKTTYKSKPTATFTAFSNYIDAKGTAISSSSNVKRLNYKNLNDDYFGTLSISVYGYGNDINFYFSTSGGKLSISIYDYSSAHIHVSYKETLGNVEVSMDYSSLYSAYSGEVDYVKVSDVEQSKSSNLYPTAVSNAQKAVNAATTWMSAIVRNALGGSLTVHDLYNH